MAQRALALRERVIYTYREKHEKQPYDPRLRRLADKSRITKYAIRRLPAYIS